MFEILLDSHIEATHRKINGMGACRFLIHTKTEASV
jgi:predicted ArsR family transcriptional regulator